MNVAKIQQILCGCLFCLLGKYGIEWPVCEGKPEDPKGDNRSEDTIYTMQTNFEQDQRVKDHQSSRQRGVDAIPVPAFGRGPHKKEDMMQYRDMNTFESGVNKLQSPSIQVKVQHDEQTQQVFDDNFVRVVAPESLPEGFTFEARVSDETFLATVVSLSFFFQ